MAVTSYTPASYWSGLSQSATQVSDNTYATSSAKSGNTALLRSTAFGFSVPTDAIIEGIEVIAEYNTATAGLINDTTQLVMRTDTSFKTTDRIGSNLATAATSTTMDQTITFGGPTNLWGATLTTAIVHNANFGVDFWIKNNSGSTVNINFDYLAMRVYYVRPYNRSTRTFAQLYQGTRGLGSFYKGARDFTSSGDVAASVPTYTATGKGALISHSNTAAGIAGWNYWNSGTIALNATNGTALGWTGSYVEDANAGRVAVDDRGQSTGNNSGIYPDAILVRCWYATGSLTVGYNVTISGLDNSKYYDLTLLGSRGGSTDRASTYVVNGVSQVQDNNNNSSRTIVFSKVQPTSGAITIRVLGATLNGTLTPYSYLNTTVIQEYSGS